MSEPLAGRKRPGLRAISFIAVAVVILAALRVVLPGSVITLESLAVAVLLLIYLRGGRAA